MPANPQGAIALRLVSAALLAVLAVSVSACDAGEQDLPDPARCPEPLADETDFMPLQVGARWIYAYKESGFWFAPRSPWGSDFFHNEYFHNEGELELEITERTCWNGTASYTVRETNRRDVDSAFPGAVRGGGTTVEERVFTETEQHHVSLPPFFIPSFPFSRYRVTSADTVAAPGISPCDSHSSAGSSVRLRRGVGIDVVRTHIGARYYFCQGLMTLVDGPVP